MTFEKVMSGELKSADARAAATRLQGRLPAVLEKYRMFHIYTAARTGSDISIAPRSHFSSERRPSSWWKVQQIAPCSFIVREYGLHCPAHSACHQQKQVATAFQGCPDASREIPEEFQGVDDQSHFPKLARRVLQGDDEKGLQHGPATK